MHVIEAMTGGTRRFILDLAGGLPRGAFTQHFVLSLRRDPFGERDIELLSAAGVKVTVVEMTRSICPPSDARALRAIRRAIETWRPHIVHGHSSKGGFLARAAVRWARLKPRPKAVYTPHCFAFSARVSPPRAALYAALERLAARWTDFFAFISRGELAAAAAAGIATDGRAAMVPLGVDTERFSRVSATTRSAAGLPGGFVFISVGSLRPQKNHALLLRALALAFGADANVHIAIAGDGPLRKRLERMAAGLGIGGRVHFLGHRDDLPDLLPLADAFVLSSAWEGLPYSLLEAMACGLPVVVPDLEGVSDLVAAAGAGVVFHAGLATALAAALQAVAKSAPSQRAAWGDAGRAYIAAHHTVDHCCRALASIYRSLVQ